MFVNILLQNIDLHALTGWIPERVAIRTNSDEFNPDKEFDRILDRFHKGDCLITVATGVMSEADGERAGLVPTHAYAMLDIRKVLVSVHIIMYIYKLLLLLVSLTHTHTYTVQLYCKSKISLCVTSYMHEHNYFV